jgi:hypothetical protein
MKEHYDKEKEAVDKQQNTLNNKGKNEIAHPNIPNPDYIAKAPRK